MWRAALFPLSQKEYNRTGKDSEKGQELFSCGEWWEFCDSLSLKKSSRMGQNVAEVYKTMSVTEMVNAGYLFTVFSKRWSEGYLKDLPVGRLQTLQWKWLFMWCRCKHWNSFTRMLQILKLDTDVRKKSSLLLLPLPPLWLWTLYKRLGSELLAPS